MVLFIKKIVEYCSTGTAN